MLASFRSAVAAIVLVLGVSACASVYHARVEGGADGYSERQLEGTRWRVEYVGDEIASRPQVESFLLLRAAEVTIANGYDWFVPSAYESEREEELVIVATIPRSAVWRPVWRERRRRLFWSDWQVMGATSAPAAIPARPYTSLRYAAREDILLGRGEAPADAFDAREIVAALAPGSVRD